MKGNLIKKNLKHKKLKILLRYFYLTLCIGKGIIYDKLYLKLIDPSKQSVFADLKKAKSLKM